ncbi:hypothetical protein [Cupriavidus sp. SW-Y-13]|uniref:hypothetical protein n=1 Tax=Cupriavidus sp. SW-Y-13 TaxID=2653854 RepID=UPI001365AC5B|nr:hypothetical protein [Cupriavidus sp. SW-Y-13]MWL87677.1 hypothetical protein [Cupriavidus sp. SW-Y-13]
MNQANLSANDLAAIIKSDLSGFDSTLTPSALCRHFERVTQKRISFAGLILAMLHAGFAVLPSGKSFRFQPMFNATN